MRPQLFFKILLSEKYDSVCETLQFYGVCITHTLYLAKPVLPTLQNKSIKVRKQWLNNHSDHMDLQYTHKYPIFGSWISTRIPITVTANKKMFFGMKFLAPTCYKGVYTCILDCSYGLAYRVADTHLVVDITILLVKVEGDVEARWASIRKWGRLCMHWLWLSQQCWESD